MRILSSVDKKVYTKEKQFRIKGNFNEKVIGLGFMFDAMREIFENCFSLVALLLNGIILDFFPGTQDSPEHSSVFLYSKSTTDNFEGMLDVTDKQNHPLFL